MRKIAWIGGAALAVAAAAALGAGIATATTAGPATMSPSEREPEPDKPDAPLTGSVLDRAKDAALKHTGGGDVTETEVGDDGAAYGVEIRKPDGHHVEVELDKAFNVTGEEADDGDAD
jgi:hypothetical protein